MHYPVLRAADPMMMIMTGVSLTVPFSELRKAFELALAHVEAVADRTV